ncbi:MAG: hypothetical protein ACK4UW_20440 [Rhizobium rhizophilum]|uniref:hypothetical protein n=1 Tax=Rhizobium rhizophilum TaxID=1850373 RepID=UPI00391D487D
MPKRKKMKKRKPLKTVGAPAAAMIGDASENLKALRGDMAQILRTSDESLRQKLGSVYREARVLSRDLDQWQNFCGQEEWLTHSRRPKPTPDGMADALKHAVRFAVGFDGATSNNAVYRYRAVLQQCWERGLPFDQVPKAIEDAGGIEKMKRNRARQSSSMKLHLAGKAFVEKLEASASPGGALLFAAFRKDGDASCFGEVTTGLLQNEGRLTQEVMESFRTLANAISSRRPL